MSTKKKKHGWNRLKNYLDVHDSVLGKYSRCFTNNPSYSARRLTPQMLELSATLNFSHKGLKLEIEKTVEIAVHGKGLESARTYSYSYVVSDRSGCLFRYCSPHATHNQFHHKHLYDPITRQQVLPPLQIGEDDYPHVDEVIEELLAL
jgi:hypothetical protein